MKFALLLCLLGWYGSLLSSCSEPDVQPPKPESADESYRNAKPLDRVARAADPSDAKDTGGRDGYSEYRTLQTLRGPRRHRFLHFGRKRALPLYPDLADDSQEYSDDYIGDDDYVSYPEFSEASGRWTKPYFEVGLGGDSELTGHPKDDKTVRYKREVGMVSARNDDPNADAAMDKRTPIEVHDELAEDSNANTYANWQEREKKSQNRIMHFGKREGQGETTYQRYEDQDHVKRALNRILHFGKRPQGGVASDYQGEGYGWFGGEDKRIGNRIMHFGKREGSDDSNSPSTESIKSKRDARLNRIMHFGKRWNDDLIPEFGPESITASKRVSNRIMHFGKRNSAISGPLEDELKRDFLEWKKRYNNRILHFGKKRRPNNFPGKRPINRIMHFGKRDIIRSSSEENDDSTDRQKRQLRNSILHFGKRDNEGSAGKRFKNVMMHFGKRKEGYPHDDMLRTDTRLEDSEDNVGKDTGETREYGPSGNNDSKFENDYLIEEHEQHKRRKRSLDLNEYDLDETLERVVHELMNAGYVPKRVSLGHPGLPGHLHLPHAFVAAQVYGSSLPRMLSRPSRSDRFFPVPYSGEHREVPKGPSRNVFLHFG